MALDNTNVTQVAGTSRRRSGPKAVWTADDDKLIISTLRDEKDKGNQADSGWKKVVWVACAVRVAKEGSTKGGIKTAEKCSDRFKNVVAALLFILNVVLNTSYS
jgi:hypothetical protein